MKKIRVKVKKKTICEVEYICEVDDNVDMTYGIGEIESIGDFGGADAMGFYCKDISEKVSDGGDCEIELVEWEEIKDED